MTCSVHLYDKHLGAPQAADGARIPLALVEQRTVALELRKRLADMPHLERRLG